MGRSRNLADLLDANGDVKSGSLDNVPPSNDASALTTGTLSVDRLAAGSIGAAKLAETYQTPLVAGTDYQTPLTAGTDYLAPNGDGSGLSGIETSSSNLVTELNTAASVTIRQPALFNTSFEVGDFPTINNYTTTVSDFGAGYNSPDISYRTGVIVYSQSTSAARAYADKVYTYQDTGRTEYDVNTQVYAVSSPGNDGTYRQVNGYLIGASAWDNKFFAGAYHQGYDSYEQSASGARVGIGMFSINPSTGAITGNGQVTSTRTNGSSTSRGVTSSVNSSGINRNPNYQFGFLYSQAGTSKEWRMARWDSSGNATSSGISEAEYNYWRTKTGLKQFGTTNLIHFGGDKVYRDSSYTTCNPSTITPTEYTPLTNSAGSANWKWISDTKAVASYTNTSGEGRFALVTFDSSGVPTEADNVKSGGVSAQGDELATGKVISGTTTYEFDASNNFTTNADGSLAVGQYLTPLGSVRQANYESGNLSVDMTDLAGNGKRIKYTSPTWTTFPTNVIGVINETTSAATVGVVTSGIVDGYSGLTAGVNYYATKPYDGTLTTTNTGSENLIGEAISSTQLKLKV